MSYLIKDTTEEERRKIVEDALGNLDGACDGCSLGITEMYEAYIRGEKEIQEINMASIQEMKRDYYEDKETINDSGDQWVPWSILSEQQTIR